MIIEKILKEQNIEELKYVINNKIKISNKKFIKFIKENDNINLVFFQKIIDSGININKYSKDFNQRPLSIALIEQKYNIIEILLKNGANPNFSFIEIIEFNPIDDNFLEFNTFLENIYTPLLFAIEHKLYETIKILLKFDANINILDENKNTVLMIILEKFYYFNFNESKSIEIIQLLLEYGIDINQINNQKETALSISLAYKRTCIIKLLILNKVNMNLCNSHKIYSLEIGNLFIKYGIKIQKRLGIENLSSSNLIKLLIDNGANIDDTDIHGNTILMECIKKSVDIDKIKRLIDCGASVNIQNKYQDTALIIASSKENIEIVKYLVEKGKANISIKNDNKIDVLHLANNEIKKFLLKQDISFKRKNKKSKQIEKVRNRYIIKSKPSILLTRRDFRLNYLPLDSAIKEIVKWEENYLYDILETRPLTKINIQNKEGITALMKACKKGDLDFIQILLNFNANIFLEDNNNYTAKDYAKLYNRKNSEKVLNILNEYQKKFNQKSNSSKKLINLLTNFTIDTPIKYSTHLWDFSSLKEEYTNFKGFINEIDKQWRVIGEELKELSPKLHEKIYNFLLNDNPTKSWCSKADIAVGWSSLDGLEEWCNEGRNPFDFELKESIEVDNQTIATFGEVITLFKKEIEIRNDSNMLENIFLAQKRKLGRAFKMELIKLKGRSFYTDVESFQNAIDRLFQEIQKRKEHKSIKVEVIEPDAQSIEIVITQIGSKANRDIKEMVDEVEDGDFKMLKETLTNLCDWSIESDSENGGYRVNYLSESTKQKSEKLLDTPNGFKYILRFYKK